jgi:ABC-2 type transport system ATP-binding protein
MSRRAGRMSGGQRAQLALTLAIAKRPELLILDEPVAALDPLARHDFLDSLKTAIAGGQLSVVLSSHLVSDLEQVCDYLIVLAGSRVQVSGDLTSLLATHYRLAGPSGTPAGLPPGHRLIAATHAGPQATLVVRGGPPARLADWTAGQVSLEDLVLAYMSQSAGAAHPEPALEAQS